MVDLEKIGMKLSDNTMKSINNIRKDFPFFKSNPKTTFLDSAASSLTPKPVIEAVQRYYEKYSVNIHRGVYKASMEASQIYEEGREKIKIFLNSCDDGIVVYVRNTTEGLNLITQCLSQVSSLNNSSYFAWSRGFSSGDIILLSESEHHANIVPWQIIANRHSLKIEYLPINLDNGTINLEVFEDFKKKLKNKCVKIVSLAQASNVTGIMHDLTPFQKYAREKGALFIVDGAQSVCHSRIDLKELDPDFFVFSGHKMLGPTGIGILWGKAELMKKLPPYMGGGDMILSVSKEKIVYNTPPHKFEAGTPDIAGVFGLQAAIDYINSFDRQELEKKENYLIMYAMKKMKEAGLIIYGPKLEEIEKGHIKKIGVISFGISSVHPHDVGSILDQENIAIRVGHHCCQILMEAWKAPATCRASIHLYNDVQDIDHLMVGITEVKKIFMKTL